MPSNALETLLDEFYTKRHSALGSDAGKVCRIFNNAFTPRHSYAQNNWRDFFRYGLGVGCLAPELQLAGNFVAEPRAECRYLVSNASGKPACRLHPTRTRYIRGLDKPKLLHWQLEGARGTYKLVNLDDPRLLEVMKPQSSRVPLDALIAALYFGAAWSGNISISAEQFAEDFHFRTADEVRFLFATDVLDPNLQRDIARVRDEIVARLEEPFVLRKGSRVSLSVAQRRVRDEAFREAVCSVYEHACCVCRLQIDAAEGKWEVQAAHIYPHRLGGVDDVRNGLALCRTHHWAFDEHVFTINNDHELIWSPRARGKTICVQGRIKLPENTGAWPHPRALTWHRKRTVQRWKGICPEFCGKRKTA